MRYSNLHTHTIYSDGKNTAREMVETAIANNMVSLGFSDHSYTDFDLRYCIQKDKLGEYINEIKSLKKEYEGQIEIYLGYEQDGFAKIEDRSVYDYIIGDTHYVRTENGLRDVDYNAADFSETLNTCFGGDAFKFAKAYYELYAECIPQLRPDILGHFDLVTKFGYIDENDPRYRSLALEVLDSCLEICPIAEMNTGAISRGYRKTPYPAPFILERIKEKGGKIILSSDCHNKDYLLCHFDECLDTLRAHSFDSVVALIGGKFTEIGIND